MYLADCQWNDTIKMTRIGLKDLLTERHVWISANNSSKKHKEKLPAFYSMLIYINECYVRP